MTIDIRLWLKGRKLAYVLGGVVVVGLVMMTFRAQPVLQDVDSVTRGRVEVSVHGEGKTRVRENYVISAPVTGSIMRIEFEPGDEVIAGETVVATIEPADPTFLDARSQAQAEARVKGAEAALDLAKAEVVRKEAELEFADKEMIRAEELSQNQTISQRTLDQRILDVKMHKAELLTARSNMRMAGFDLENAKAMLMGPDAKGDSDDCCIKVRSPVSGRILRRLNESERVVQVGTPLLELGDLADMEVEVDLLSADAVKVEAGDRVYIDHWGGDARLLGRVVRVEPSGFTKISALGIEEQRVWVIIDIIEPRENWSSLGDGFRVEAYVVVDEAHDVTLAPISALFRNQEGWQVYQYKSGRAVLTPVQVGIKNDFYAEILGGLDEGDVVIVHPSNAVEDGTRVKTRK